MFAHLQGKIAEKRPDSLVLDVGGVGYLVRTNTATIARAGQNGDTFKVYTHLVVREDGLDLCGFATKEECATFQKLISVSGVGLKSALALLSQMSVADFSLALLSQDAKAIAKTPGLGLKTAQKIILELKDKVRNDDLLQSISEPAAVLAGGEAGYVQDAIEALCALGYPTADAAKAVSAVKDQAQTADELVRLALRRFSV